MVKIDGHIVGNKERLAAGGEGLPVTEDAYQKKSNDSIYIYSDNYLAKFNPDCSKLLYCSYFSGWESEEFVGVKLQIDNIGSIYLSGITRSTDLPVTANAWKKTKLHPSVDRHDIYIAKFNKKLDSLEYCTYFGTDYSDSYALTQVDDNGCLYLSGSTMNKTFTTTEDVYRNAFNSHHSTYLSKLNQNGSNFVFSTFICGENGKDYDGTIPEDIYRTKSGDIYMIGNTQRGFFPLDYDVIFDKTPNRYDENIAFIAKIDTLGRDVLYSAIMKRWASYPKIRVSDNFIYIGWNPYLFSYPITPDAYQNELKGTSSAGFMVLSLDMKQIIYSTALGGTIRQEVLDMDINNSGEVVLSGWTESPDFPTTQGVYQESVLGIGPYYGFVAKFRFPTGVNEQPKAVNGYSLYPNPARSGETVSITTQSELFSANAAVTLYNSIGKEISDIHFINYGTKFEFAVNSLSSGIYFIKIRNNNTEQTLPFAVIK